MKLESLNDLFLDEIADLQSAEEQLVKALPKLVESASNPRLKEALSEHHAATLAQAERLRNLVQTLPTKPKSKTCKAMKGLIDECEEMIKSADDPSVGDAGLIAVAQRVEHYEIAAYGCARTFAELLGNDQAVHSLSTSLQEEKDADETLNDLAKNVINLQAAQA